MALADSENKGRLNISENLRNLNQTYQVFIIFTLKNDEHPRQHHLVNFRRAGHSH